MRERIDEELFMPPTTMTDSNLEDWLTIEEVNLEYNSAATNWGWTCRRLLGVKRIFGLRAKKDGTTDQWLFKRKSIIKLIKHVNSELDDLRADLGESLG